MGMSTCEGGYVRAHGCRLTGKMSGGGLRSVAWASVITLVESSVITLSYDESMGFWDDRCSNCFEVNLECCGGPRPGPAQAQRIRGAKRILPPLFEWRGWVVECGIRGCHKAQDFARALKTQDGLRSC